MSVNFSVGTEACINNNFWTFLSMLLFGQKQNEIHAGLIDNHYPYTRISFLIMQFTMTAYLFKDIFATKRLNMQYLLLNNIPHISSSLPIFP